MQTRLHGHVHTHTNKILAVSIVNSLVVQGKYISNNVFVTKNSFLYRKIIFPLKMGFCLNNFYIDIIINYIRAYNNEFSFLFQHLQIYQML